MRSRISALSVAVALVVAACSGGATAPDPTLAPATSAAPATTEAPVTTLPTETTVAAPADQVEADSGPGVPGHVTGAVVVAMAGTSLAEVTHEEVAEDVAAGCEAASGSDAAALLEDLSGIVAGRMFLYGEPADGDVSARYSLALGGAFQTICPDAMAAVPVASGEEIEPVDHSEEIEGALEALALGLENTPLEGMLDSDWPATDVVPVLEEICRLADSRHSNVTIFEYATDMSVERLDPAQGELDLITVSLITVAVVFMCPWNSRAVLGP